MSDDGGRRDTYAVGDHLDGNEGTVGKVHVQSRHVNVRASRSVGTLRIKPTSTKVEQLAQPRLRTVNQLLAIVVLKSDQLAGFSDVET
jgi:hypothetical protein